MKTLELLTPFVFVLAGCAGVLLLVLLPWMIASSRKAQHAVWVRRTSLAGVVLSTFGFLWILLAQHRAGLMGIIFSLTPGAIVWLISLLWGCLGRPAQIIRGFEVRPLGESVESSGTNIQYPAPAGARKSQG